MVIAPDTKDWTWVVERRCPECGFDPAVVDPAEVAAAPMVARWRAVLARPGARDRPDDATWSDLEYACHVRDVLTLFAERLRLIRTEDDPLFANWDQDATAVDDHYAAQVPAVVAGELAPAAAAFDAELAAVTDWNRPGRRSNGSAFTAATLTTYALHDLHHHLEFDVRG